jgi:ATP-binding cassette subfamily F protein uup
VWLDRGRTRRLAQGFGAFEAWRDTVLEEEEQAAHKLDRKIVEEEHWLRYGVTARRKRNQKRLASLVDMRKARKSARLHRPPGEVRLALQEARLSGKLVVEAEGVAKSFGGRSIVGNLDIRIERGDRLGIVGPNGAGKTTILNLLTGVLPPDAGTVRLGANVDLAGLDQRRATLDPEATVAETLTDGRGDTVIIGSAARHVIGYMKDFLFRPEQARTPVKALSGGERGRLMLARALARPSNLLVLDEPTNDLDLETLDLLQELLAEHQGTLLLVSHDRDFLDRIVTSVLASEGDGRWTEYAGGYSDMVAQRGHGIARRRELKEEKAAAIKPMPRAAGPSPKRKLSFAEQQALKTLPGRIEALDREIVRLEGRLSETGFCGRDPAGFAAAGRDLARARAERDAAEEEWLRVEMLREALERR